MVRRITPSQFRSRAAQRRTKLRQLQNKLRQNQVKRRQAIQRYNQKVRAFNRAIESYNRAVRTHQTRRRQNLQRLKSELSRLERQQSFSGSLLRSSVDSLHLTYQRLEQSVQARETSAQENYYLDLAEGETANSVAVLNALLSPADEDLPSEEQKLRQTRITDEIIVISEDLHSRWEGALFALSPRNPEASRHFCSSAREIFVALLDLQAPDGEVLDCVPDCALTENGNPTRRSKIEFLLTSKGLTEPEFVEFASADVDNIIELFGVLNKGTHGQSGSYAAQTLLAIKRRVEDGLIFLSRVAA